MQRLSQAKIAKCLCSLSKLSGAVNDARVRYQECRTLRAKKLSGTIRLMRKLAYLSHDSDYAPFESQLKKKLIRLLHNLHGVPSIPYSSSTSLSYVLPVVYQEYVDSASNQVKYLLKVLSDVDAGTKTERSEGE